MNNKLALVLAGILVVSGTSKSETQSMKTEGLDYKQRAMVTIAAFTASGDLPKLTDALNEGLDAGLTIMKSRKFSCRCTRMPDFRAA